MWGRVPFEAPMERSRVCFGGFRLPAPLAARLGWDFRYHILKWLIFTDLFQFYPTIGEGGDYFFRNEAALNVPLSAHWSLKLANIIDYNSNPSPGFERTDVQYIGALQFSF